MDALIVESRAFPRQNEDLVATLAKSLDSIAC